jgi:hypothetical protein
VSPSDVDGFDMHGDPDLLPDGDDAQLQLDLADFRDGLRAFADRPAPAMSQELARFVAGLGGLTEPVPEASRRKRPMILQTLTAKLAAGGVAAFATFSGLAAAGALPNGVQSAVSSAGDSVGIGIPHPGDHGPEALSAPSSTTTTATAAESSTSATTTTTVATTTTTSTSSTEGVIGETSTGDDESSRSPNGNGRPACRADEPTVTTTPVDGSTTVSTAALADPDPDPDACDVDGAAKPECSEDWTQPTNPRAAEQRSESGTENIQHRDGACEDRRLTAGNHDEGTESRGTGDEDADETTTEATRGAGNGGGSGSNERSATSRTTTSTATSTTDADHTSGSGSGSGSASNANSGDRSGSNSGRR